MKFQADYVRGGKGFSYRAKSGFMGNRNFVALLDSGYSVTVIYNIEKLVHSGKMPSYENKKPK